MDRKERLRIEKLYGHLYKRVSGINWYKCIYCGFPYQCWDHVPPLSFVEYIDIKKYKSNNGKFRLFPSCMQCNNLLYNCRETDIYGRLEYLMSKYNKRFKKMPYWSQNELNELGKNMRAFVLNNTAKYDLYAQKLDNISENIASDEYVDLL